MNNQYDDHLVTISFCHGQEHAGSHSHFLVVTEDPDQPGIVGVIDQPVNNFRYELEQDGQKIEVWLLHPEYTPKSMVRRLIRIMDVVILTTSVTSNWQEKYLQGDEIVFELGKDSAEDPFVASDLQKIINKFR